MLLNAFGAFFFVFVICFAFNSCQQFCLNIQYIQVSGHNNRAEQLVLLAMQAIVALSVLLVFASNNNIVRVCK